MLVNHPGLEDVNTLLASKSVISNGTKSLGIIRYRGDTVLPIGLKLMVRAITGALIANSHLN